MTGIIDLYPLGFHWTTEDPFLFCAHHLDAYPKGNDNQGPEADLSDRSLGQDFDLKKDWKMYHGTKVPGFPVHPHRGFETITVVLEGLVDHFDSAGASGRYGAGDVQWMTAGAGMQHCEMFPLTKMDEENPLHLFQIWLNLPKKDKFVEPHYKMLWREDVPKVFIKTGGLIMAEITVIAGTFEDVFAHPPAPDSYAANPGHHVDILLIHMAPFSTVVLPEKTKTMSRNLYFYEGTALTVQDVTVNGHQRIKLGYETITLKNGDTPGYCLLLQGEPIGEPVVQYGPFVMNTSEEIQKAYSDYQATAFGGWPWERPDPVHDPKEGRVAKYADGREERPDN